MNTTTKSTHAASMRAGILLLVAASCLLTRAQAQTLLTTHGNLLAVIDQPVPGPSGAYFQVFDVPVIADDGTVLFLAKMYGGDVSGNGNSRALFRGTTAADLSIMLRSSDPAPGLAGLALVNSAANNGIQAGSRLTPDGRTFWSSFLSGPGVTSTNDTAMFGGFPGSLAPIVREGAAAPGTTGAVFSGDRITSTQFTTMNRNGAVLFQSTLSGGDVVGATNNQALYTGTAGALSIVVRKGATVLPGPLTASTFPTSGILAIDSNGRVLYSLNLAGAGVGTANDASLWLYTPGSGNTLLAREGQIAPGTAGATFGNSFETWQPSLSPDGFSNGQYVMTAELQGGDVVAGVNDLALYIGSATGLTMVARKGNPAPGTDALFAAFITNNTYINNTGVVLSVASLMGGTSSSVNNAAVYVATPTGIPAAPYTLSLIMRAGDPAPGTPGDFFGPAFNQGAAFNDSGQAVFTRDLRGGDAMFGLNDKGLYAWDPVKGLFLLARAGDQIEVAPGLFWTAYNFAYVSNSNTDGSALGLSKTGTLALNVGFLDGGSSVATLDMRCYPVYYPDADGDGYGDASSTDGVCSNASPPAGSVPNHTDCNDANPAVFKTYYQDADGDGYGNASVSVCDDATPPAGYVPYGTDCNVADPTIHPDRSDDSCDGVDQNCNGANDEGYVTHQSTCGLGPCAHLGVAQCSNGVVIDTCVPGTPGAETCPANGIDDNCDGTVDNVAPPSGALTMNGQRLVNGAAHLTWNAALAATGYDLVTGSLQILHSNGGSFSAATTQCLANDLPATSFDAPAIPAAGQGLWYLIRAGNCGGSTTYNSGFPSQVGSRDAGIAASGHGCP